MTFADFVQ